MSSDQDDQKATAGAYQAFRQRLDAVLRRRDPAALRAFLVAEGQWQADAQTDVDAAMWMMIATSKALSDLHGDARAWLLAHGHAAEANAIFGERPRPGGGQGRPSAQHGPPPHRGHRRDGPRGGHPAPRTDRRGDAGRPPSR
jgi:hypothetical protein